MKKICKIGMLAFVMFFAYSSFAEEITIILGGEGFEKGKNYVMENLIHFPSDTSEIEKYPCLDVSLDKEATAKRQAEEILKNDITNVELGSEKMSLDKNEILNCKIVEKFENLKINDISLIHNPRKLSYSVVTDNGMLIFLTEQEYKNVMESKKIDSIILIRCISRMGQSKYYAMTYLTIATLKNYKWK